MKKIEMTEFINSVATFNADPYCVEDDLCEECGVKELKGLVIDRLPNRGCWKE